MAEAPGFGRPEATGSPRFLLVLPHARRDGFWANIRGHVLDLADPSSGGAIAPTPDDLFVAAIASELAWSARRALHARGLPENVSVSADWQALDEAPFVSQIGLTVTVAKGAEVLAAELTASFRERIAARSCAPDVRIDWKGANR